MRIRDKVLIVSIAVLAGTVLLTPIKGEAANSPLGTCYYLYESVDCLKSGGTLDYKKWENSSTISINKDRTWTALSEGHGVPFGAWYEFEQSFCFQTASFGYLNIVYAGTKKQGFKNLSKVTVADQFVYPGCWYLVKAKKQTYCPWLFEQTTAGKEEALAEEEDTDEIEESEEEIKAGFMELKEKWMEVFEKMK